MVNGRIVREDDASLIPWIDANGFDTFEREAAAQLEAERAAHEGEPSRDAAIDAVRAAASSLGAGIVQSLRATWTAPATAAATRTPAKEGRMSKKRTEVADIDRSLYDFTYGEEGFERLDAGLTPDIVTEISQRKDEPQWMLDFRLKSLEIYHKMPNPTWGPGIEGLDMDNIVTYVKPNTEQKNDWESVPDDIKNTFERLGIPEAERSYLAGVGAQYDSELVYHNMQDTASKMGIVYSGIEEALHEPRWEAIIREKFMTLIPPTDHKFAALHGAVWSGGSFVYVPKGVKLDFPLQSYFRLNAKGAGQFEHTLIVVEDDADLHFIEGCSAPKYNVANLHAGAVELFVGKRAHLRYSTIRTGPRTCTT